LESSVSEKKLRIVRIVKGTTVDGPGFRTSIYFAGCQHRCPGCHNESTWPMDAGYDVTIAELLAEIDNLGMDVTFSGGDPLYQWENLQILAHEIKKMGYTVWCYTGFTYEALASRAELQSLLCHMDVLVDGPFVQNLRDISLLFRGSSNQRLIDLRKSTPECPVLWESDF